MSVIGRESSQAGERRQGRWDWSLDVASRAEGGAVARCDPGLGGFVHAWSHPGGTQAASPIHM